MVSVMLTVDERKSKIAVELADQFRDRHPEALVLWVYACDKKISRARRPVCPSVVITLGI